MCSTLTHMCENRLITCWNFIQRMSEINNLLFTNDKLESLLEEWAAATTTARVDENHHRHQRCLRVVVVLATTTMTLSGSCIVQSDGFAHCKAKVLRHPQLLGQILFVHASATRNATDPQGLHNHRR